MVRREVIIGILVGHDTMEVILLLTKALPRLTERMMCVIGVVTLDIGVKIVPMRGTQMH